MRLKHLIIMKRLNYHYDLGYRSRYDLQEGFFMKETVSFYEQVT